MADDPPTGETVDIADPAAEASPFAALEPSPEGAPAPVVTGAANGLAAGRLDLVFDVPVCLSVELGRNLGRGSIIELDRGPGAPLDVRVNGVLIGRGEVVLVNSERLGLRFVEVVSQAERVKRLD
jgi:flagellar motor switch protein FliN/FliY